MKLVPPIVAALMSLCLVVAPCAAEIYYIDAKAGDDANVGTSPDRAWRSLDKINATTFQPGDRVLLKAGSTWVGQLAPKGSGADGRPISIDQYGTGTKPAIRGEGAIAALLLSNQEYWEIANLDNTRLYLWSESATHPRDPAWSAWHHTGVRIRKNRLVDIGKNAMAVRASLAPVIEYNTVERAAARLHGNAIYVFGCKDAVMQFNEVFLTRFDAIEGAAFDSDYNSEGTLIQYNYSHDNGGGLVNLCSNPASKPPRGFNDGTIVRYNISQNETERVIAFDGSATNTQIYNNTIYVGPGLSPRIVEFDLFGRTPGFASGVQFRNNIIYNAGNGGYAWGEATRVVWEANTFFGTHPANEPADAFKLTTDPGFIAPGSGGAGLGSLAGYGLTSGAASLDTGREVGRNGGRDFWGNPLYAGAPDRGAQERPRAGGHDGAINTRAWSRH